MKTLIFLLLLVSIAFSCDRTEQDLEETIESVLPGEWNIISLEINSVFHSEPNDFEDGLSDTILYDVGSVIFPELGLDTLSLNGPGAGVGIDCYISDNENLEIFKIEKIWVRDEECFVYFREHEGRSLPADSELNSLIEFTHLFWVNMDLRIENENQISFHELNRESIVLSLQRK